MMINLTENEQLGLILPYLYDEYDIGAVEQLIDETFSIDNLSELSIKSQHLITDAAKKHGLNVSFKTKVAKTFAEIHKYNPYHDSKGRFARAKGSKMVVVQTPNPWQKRSSVGKNISPKTGKISKERMKLYNSIIDAHFEGVEKPTGKPKLEYMGGGGASGKSYTLDSGYLKTVPKGKKAVQINADDIKSMLPEYKDMVNSGNKKQQKKAAEFVHQESSILAKQITAMALDQGYNVVVDGTASNAKKLKNEIKKARRNGYEVNVHYINAPIETALNSNKKRFEEEGRYVPDKVLIEAHQSVSKNFEKLSDSGLFDSIEIINNNRKDPLSTIYSKKKDEDAIINDSEAYQQFIDKKDYS
ncbi:zeta toxin family protein [Eubacterium limosum]|uniref:zeta toxin family protein n=1 Tax=Eubacterium limosum TaxID=1736 RepID=UPI001D071AA6|nr:zeta toxin family protein [Eubacterium limosum]MCB6569994.1 zeta toxin family protein [Eubacterium limosum]